MIKKSKLKFSKVGFIVFSLTGIISFLVYKNISSSSDQSKSPLYAILTPHSKLESKTFTHEAGFSFSYPPEIKVTQLSNPAFIVLRSTETKDDFEDYNFDSTVKILQNQDKLPLYDYVNKEERVINGQIPTTVEYSGETFIRRILAFEHKSVGGKLAYLFRADPCSICRGETYTTYIEQSPTQVVSIELFVDKTSPKPKSYEIYNQILSTFQFQN